MADRGLRVLAFAHRVMAALQRLLPHHVRAQRDGAVVVIPSEDVVPGDVIYLTAGEDVPADCRLVEGFGVRVNNATVTGEPRPVSREVRPSPEADLLQSSSSRAAASTCDKPAGPLRSVANAASTGS